MRSAKDLTHEELVLLVDRVQQELFLESNEAEPTRWNFSKMHDYRDLLQHLADLLDQFELAPDC